MSRPSRRARVLVIAGAVIAGAASVAVANLGGLDLTPNTPAPYGPIGVGSQETKDFMVFNGQPSPTTAVTWSFSGPGSGAFRMVMPCTTLANGMPCQSTPIPGSSSIPVEIRCQPMAPGTFNVTISVSTTVGGDPAGDSVNLTCTANGGGGGSIILTPGAGHAFGSVEVDTTSLPFTFDLENDTGLDPLDNIDISVGPGFVLGTPCVGMQSCLISPMLAQGGHLPIEVRGAPTQLMGYNDMLSVGVGSAATFDSAPITVTGVPPAGGGPELSLDTNQISVTAAFNQSDSQPLTISNEGTGDLNVTLSIGGLHAARWFASPPCAPSCTIAPGPSNALTVDFFFSPTVVGDQSATVRFQTNDLDDGENDFTLSLEGTGTGGVLSAPSTLIDIGQVRIGNSGAQSFLVGNTGIATGLAVSVSTTAPFSIPPPDTANVAVGVPASFFVQCTPTDETTYTEDVTVAAPGAFGPTSAVFPVQCEGVISDVTITPTASWDFGGVRIGEMATKDFEVTNVGGSMLTYAVPTVSPPFSVLAPVSGGTLQPGTSVTVTVQFAPTAEAEAAMDVVGLLPAETDRVIHVVGHGTLAAYTVTPSEVDLGTACLGDTLMTPVTLRVTGSSVLHVEQPDVVGDSVFALSSVAPGTLPRDLLPDESIDATVRATPAVGEHRATLVWGTDLTPGDQTAVTLAVTGIEQGLAASPGAIDFGEVSATMPASRMITIRVCATDPLSVTALLDGDPGFQLLGGQQALATAIASEPWTIVFAPARKGEQHAVLRLVPEAGDPIDIELSGTNADAGVTNYYSCGCNANTGGLGAALVVLALALANRRRRPARR